MLPLQNKKLDKRSVYGVLDGAEESCNVRSTRIDWWDSERRIQCWRTNKSNIDNLYLIEIVLRKNSNKIMVRRLGFDKEHDSWIDKTQLVAQELYLI